MRTFRHSFLLLLFFALFSNQASSRDLSELPLSSSKIIYIKNITPKDSLEKTLYVGQKISVTYSLLLLDGAHLADIEFDSSSDGVKLANGDAISWKLQENGAYQATYEYKILSKIASIPQLKATALSRDQRYKDIAIAPKIALDIYDLKSNAHYSGVVGQELKVLSNKTKMLDDKDADSLIELESINANLEDFSIPDVRIIKQGFKTPPQEEMSIDPISKQPIRVQRGLYHITFPKNIASLRLDFFSLEQNQFQTIDIPIIIANDDLTAQDSPKPKNIFLLYSTLFLIAIILVAALAYAFIWRNRAILIVIILLVILLAWHVFYHNSRTLEIGESVKILPTQNSTTLFVVQEPMKVKIIGSHNDFYKIETADEKVGWIKKRK